MTLLASRLAGKTVLITGASSGIGRSTALEFARSSPQNLRIILTARRLEKLTETAQDIVGRFPDVKVRTTQLDSSNPPAIRGFVANLPEEWRHIDILVNNA